MGSLFRSEDMTLCQLFLQAEAAYNCVSELGELGIVQFKDLNQEVNAFQKKFVQEIRRCEEMERQLRFFERELQKEKVNPIHDEGINPEAPAPRDMVDLEATYENLESELRDLNNSIEALRRNFAELKELQYVLKHTEDFFMEASTAELELDYFGHRGGDQSVETGQAVPGDSRLYLGYVAGVLPRERLPGFTRLLWFACRGNIFIRHAEIEEPIVDSQTGEPIWKVVFVAFFQGEQLKTKVKKICEGYRATLYPCSESPDERREVSLGVQNRLADITIVLDKSLEQKVRVLNTIAQNWQSWIVKVLKMKAIYHTMNMFHTEGKNYVAECWMPTREMDTAQLLLKRATEAAGSSAPSIVHRVHNDDVLPTYNRTNKFTEVFQKVVDAYGVANYKEVNPAPFAIITFPFLFSVMFGDFGHGLIMFFFALWMVIRERQLYTAAKGSEMFGMIYAGRYIVLLMGAFSVYSGLIYNDAFSKSFNIFGTGWSAQAFNSSTLAANAKLQLNPNTTTDWLGEPYPFGLDPIWQMSENKISFTNSYKKKISVIFGVAQMTLGVMLSLWNRTYFKQPMEIVCNFLPQLVFLMAMFGYLVALIFAKWIISSAYDPNCAPNILIGFINMFMFTYPTHDAAICSNWTWFPGQKQVQIGLVIAAVSSAIWMLLSKPLYLLMKARSRRRPLVLQVHVRGGINDIGTPAEGEGDDLERILPDTTTFADPVTATGEEFDFGETFIHQAIHTIEYCLGCISHTASYLRLWALSLAHAQLSEVLWRMVMQRGLMIDGYLGCIMVTAVFPPFACLTIAILLIMEGLSAFLHTLRLHWVEFQSKFYTGDGRPFHPFCFNEIIEESYE